MHAIRARHAYDGESFLRAGATVLVEDGSIIGIESYGFQVPGDCLVTGYAGTLLPGLIDAHTHLVAGAALAPRHWMPSRAHAGSPGLITSMMRRHLTLPDVSLVHTGTSSPGCSRCRRSQPTVKT